MYHATAGGIYSWPDGQPDKISQVQQQQQAQRMIISVMQESKCTVLANAHVWSCSKALSDLLCA
jgi:hypothetical protein